MNTYKVTVEYDNGNQMIWLVRAENERLACNLNSVHPNARRSATRLPGVEITGDESQIFLTYLRTE